MARVSRRRARVAQVMNSLPGLSGDRLKRAISAFVRELFPNLDYYRPWVYVVASWNDSTQTGDLQPSAASVGMPMLPRAKHRLLAEKVTLVSGQEVVVQFDNGDPTSYFISHIGTLAGGTTPDAINFSTSDDTGTPLNATRRVVRYGDSIVFGSPGPGVVALPPAGAPVSKVKA